MNELDSTGIEGVYAAPGRGQNILIIKGTSYEIDHSNRCERGNIRVVDESEAGTVCECTVIRSDKKRKSIYEIRIEPLSDDSLRPPLIMSANKEACLGTVAMTCDGKPFAKKPGIYFRYHISVEGANTPPAVDSEHPAVENADRHS